MSSALQLRAVPVGLNFHTETGYRVGLFDSDSVLLDGTYFEPGAVVDISPSNAWAGAYVDVLPLAVLQLRLGVQSINYYGTFGYLHVPEDQDNPNWELDSMSDEIGDGQPANGWLADAQVTLRAKVGNIVFLAPTLFRYVDMGVDAKYYESTFDWLLEPRDAYWKTEPTLGYVFTMEKLDSWLLAGLRWEHAETVETDLQRDMAKVMALWKMPWTVGESGEMKTAVIGGYWVNHPNRAETFYLAGQYSVEWMGL